MRNWSPIRFAHDVQVSIEGVAWRWPLSVQPGELAPFELTGLDLDAPSMAEDLKVEARLRDESDVSRAFDFDCSPPWFEGNASDLAGLVPDVVYDTLPQQGRHAMAAAFGFRVRRHTRRHRDPVVEVYYCADIYRDIASRPDWEYDRQPITIDDLRAYVAFIDYSGQVIEIRQLTVFTEYFVDDEDGNSKIRPQIITSVPDERVFDSESHRSSRARVDAFAAPDIGDIDDGFIRSASWVLWIGAAHELSSVTPTSDG